MSGVANKHKSHVNSEMSLLRLQNAELRKKVEDFDIINNSLRIGISRHIYDKNLTCYWANDAFFEIFGYSRKEFMTDFSSSARTLLHTDDLREFEDKLEHCISSGVSDFSMNVRIMTKSENMRWIQVSVSILPDNFDGNRYFVVVHNDVTDMVNARRLSDYHTRYLEKICDSMVVGILQYNVINDEPVFAYANAKTFEILECTREEFRTIFDSKVLNTVIDEEVEASAKTVETIIKTKSSARFENRITTKDGKLKWITTHMRYMPNHDGRDVLISEISDLTDKRELTAENESLLDRIHGFTANFIFSDNELRFMGAGKKFTDFFGEDYSPFISGMTEKIRNMSMTEFSSASGLTPFTFMARDKDGNNIWFQIDGSCVNMIGGCPVFLLIFTDVTDIQESHAELQELAEKYQLAYESSGELFFEYDILEDTLVIPAKGDRPRVEMKDYLKKGIFDEYKVAEDVPKVSEFLLGNTKNKVSARFFYTDKGKSVYDWLEMKANTINENGVPIKTIGTFHSVSSQDSSLFDRINNRMLTTSEPHAIICLDIDNFKMINDLYGKSSGDEVLIHISNTIKNKLHGTDCIFGRIVSDVFCICIPYKNEDELSVFLHDLESRIHEFNLDFNLTVHFGVYITNIDTDGIVPANLMFDWASLALKTIKDRYGVLYAFFDDKLRIKLVDEKQIKADMTSALENGEFIPYFQPKYDISTGRVVGAEALIRWKHPTKGLIPPDKFIPLFERNGFILNVDEYMWECTCKKMREWLDKGYTPIPISVNVSRVHAFDSGFCRKLRELVEKYSIPTNMLILEFTESVFLEDVETLCNVMNELRDNGFILSMDDFGSGYSSLNMLKTIPLNEVKIDKEFLNETVSSSKGKTVIAGTIFLMNQLEMNIVAEGVETAKQAEFLLAAGCETAQGYYYSRPLPEEDFEKLAFVQK